MDFVATAASGGGCKGISQIPYIVAVEKETGKPFYATNDLLSGTSAGAITMAVMATGKVTAEQFLSIYPDMTRSIFNKRPWYQFFKFPMYDRKRFYDEWDKLIGLDFKMGDCKTRLMITTINRVKDKWGGEQIRFFKSWKPDDAELRLVDVVSASFAAAMYFGHFNDPIKRRVYFDGGITTNQYPFDQTKTEAEVLGWYDNGNTFTLNGLGCLFVVDPRGQDYDAVSKQSTLGQLNDVFTLTDGNSRTSYLSDAIRKMEYICSFKPSLKFRFYDSTMDYRMAGMDKVQYLNDYLSIGIEMAKKPMLSIN